MIKVKGDLNTKRMLLFVAPREANNLMRSTVHAVAGEFRDEIKRTAPDRPATKAGDIVRTTKSRRRRARRGRARSTVHIGAFYWRFLEYGTVRIAPRRFVLKAFYRVRGNLQATFKQEFGQKLEALLARKARQR